MPVAPAPLLDLSQVGLPYDTVLPTTTENDSVANGQIIEGREFTGLARALHDDVEYRNCIFPFGWQRYGGLQPKLSKSNFGRKEFLVTKPRADMGWPATPTTPLGRDFNYGINRDWLIGFDGYEADLCNVWGAGDGFHASGECVIRRCHIHDLYARVTSWNTNGTAKTWNHCDGIQVLGGSRILIEGVAIHAAGYSPGGGVQSTSCVMIKADEADIDDVTLRYFTLVGTNSTPILAVSGLAGITSNVQIYGGRIVRKTTTPRALEDPWPRGGQYGVAQHNNASITRWGGQGEDVVWDDTGAVIAYDADGVIG